jgi:hypothetical protein
VAVGELVQVFVGVKEAVQGAVGVGVDVGERVGIGVQVEVVVLVKVEVKVCVKVKMFEGVKVWVNEGVGVRVAVFVQVLEGVLVPGSMVGVKVVVKVGDKAGGTEGVVRRLEHPAKAAKAKRLERDRDRYKVICFIVVQLQIKNHLATTIPNKWR